MFIPVTYAISFSDFDKTLPSSAAAGNILSWRAELCRIVERAGLDYMVIRPETKLIKKITKAVFQAIRGSSEMVKFSSYSASRGLIGVERKMEQVNALLSWESGRRNRTIGLWGMPGIGKTTLAKAFIDIFSCQFEASYFFPNFSDALTTGGLSLQTIGSLQSGFFSKLLGDNGTVGATLPYDLMLRRLGRIRALIVIDDVGKDVGNIASLKDLLNGQYCDLFAPGSVIIMTSRNKQLLKSVCHDVYEVKALDITEASRLFCLHAFRGETVQTEYLEMVGRATRYVGGNPLAITVLGTHLFDRDLRFWDRELRALQDNPDSVVLHVLRRYYEVLSPAEKEVFLDLACYLDYLHCPVSESMEEMFSEGGRVNLITNLVDQFLISIGDLSYIEMNCLLRDLGRKIINEERQIEKRSRLWKAKDIYYLFRENEGTKFTEGIFLDEKGYPENKKHDLHLQSDTFMKMKRLRFLILRPKTCNLILPENGLKYLPNTLRILAWHYFTAKYLPSQFSAENLVTLYLEDSKIEQLWEGDELTVDFGNLKFLILNGSKSLRKLPNLSTAKILEEIHLEKCESLVELPTSILDLPKLESLNVWNCSSLKLDNLECCANSSREQSSRHSDILPNLKRLNLSGTPIKKVPNFITRLHILELQCDDCTELTEFPVIPSLEELTLTSSLIEEVVGLEKLTELKRLELSNNEQLVLISGDLSKLKSMEKMKLDGCSKLSTLPDSIGNLIHLESLDLSCTALTELPSSIGNLIRLSELLLKCCESLASLPDSIGNLIHLESLDISWTAVRKLPSSIGDLIKLSKLLLKCCKSLASLPNSIHKLDHLSILDLVGCDQLRYLPELPSFLMNLDAHGCKSLQTLSIEKLNFTYTDGCFAQCWKLDPVVCNKLVDKFAQDLVEAFFPSSLLLPAKWGSESSGEEGSTKGSNNSKNNTIATAKLRGQPWKSKLTIFCALLNSPDPILISQGYNLLVECVMLNNKDSTGAEIVVDHCSWVPFREYEDPKGEQCLSDGHFLVWSTMEQLVPWENVDDGCTLEFLFRVKNKYRSDEFEIPNLVKKCLVIPVYDDRVVINEDGEEDDEESPNYLQGIYDQMCANH